MLSKVLFTFLLFFLLLTFSRNYIESNIDNSSQIYSSLIGKSHSTFLKLRSSYHKGNGKYKNLFVKHDFETNAFSPYLVKYRYGPSPRPANHVGPFTASITPVPNPRDISTLYAFGAMTFDCYQESPDKEWFDVGPFYNLTDSFGWDANGIRGHVFSNSDESLVVIAYKGTSAIIFGVGGGETGPNDKFNDNLMFSCCCAQVDPTWKPVCDCYSGGYSCDAMCLRNSTVIEDSYYNSALDIYSKVKLDFPEANVWLTGHSLGGALASLVGLTVGVPVITFEAPGDRLYASRLGLLDLNTPDNFPIYHFGHNADPVWLGVCNGVRSSCYYNGYAMETKCHTGYSCLWDVMHDNHTWVPWRLDIRNHRMKTVLNDIIEKWEFVPECFVNTNCTDCETWSFVDTL